MPTVLLKYGMFFCLSRLSLMCELEGGLMFCQQHYGLVWCLIVQVLIFKTISRLFHISYTLLVCLLQCLCWCLVFVFCVFLTIFVSITKVLIFHVFTQITLVMMIIALSVCYQYVVLRFLGAVLMAVIVGAGSVLFFESLVVLAFRAFNEFLFYLNQKIQPNHPHRKTKKPTWLWNFFFRTNQ